MIQNTALIPIRIDANFEIEDLPARSSIQLDRISHDLKGGQQCRPNKSMCLRGRDCCSGFCMLWMPPMSAPTSVCTSSAIPPGSYYYPVPW